VWPPHRPTDCATDRGSDFGAWRGTKIQILAPIARGRKGEYKKVFEELRKEGFARVRVNGEIKDLTTDEIALDKKKKHSIEVVVDRLVVRRDNKNRIADAVETALKRANGLVLIDVVDQKREILFSEHFACPECGISYEKIEPRLFSFNSPFGSCPTCTGLGFKMEIDPERVIDPKKSLRDGGTYPVGRSAQQVALGCAFGRLQDVQDRSR
jgi:excinuclease ABC subunit A